MVQKKPLLDRLMKTSTGKVVHSSGYGVAQNPGKIGVASTQSFRERMTVDKRRSFVRRYKEAQVVWENRNVPLRAGIDVSKRDVDKGVKRIVGEDKGRVQGDRDGRKVKKSDERAIKRAEMAARFEPVKSVPDGVPLTKGKTGRPPVRRNSGI